MEPFKEICNNLKLDRRGLLTKDESIESMPSLSECKEVIEWLRKNTKVSNKYTEEINSTSIFRMIERDNRTSVVSNGAVILACYYLGYKIKWKDGRFPRVKLTTK